MLSEGNADEKLDPASLTKIMTSYVVGQAIKAGKIKLTDMVTVGRDARATGNPALRGSSVMFLKPGMQVSVEDLNKGVIIQSGNDASIAIADYVAGSRDAFVSLMNGYAKNGADQHHLYDRPRPRCAGAVQYRPRYGVTDQSDDPRRTGRVRGT